MQSNLRNKLAEIRRGRGVGATELARRLGISRQTIYAIEMGSFVPNTDLALRMARELSVPFEQLFSLAESEPEATETLQTDLLTEVTYAKGQAVRMCRVGERAIGIPVGPEPTYLPTADAVIARTGRRPNRAELEMFPKDEGAPKQIVVAGCDPAIGLLASMVEQVSGVEVVPAPGSSRLALHWLREGMAHIAGTHLEDRETGEFNLPYLRQHYPDEDFAVVTFAQWESGFVTAPGNPLQIKTAADLARKDVRIVNREFGSGSRALLDQLLEEAGVKRKDVAGYNYVARGHLLAASGISWETANCCLATRSAAQSFGLGFVPLRSERYDFVIRRQTLDTPAVQAFLDVLQRAGLRRRLEVVAGYDTSQTGNVLL